MKVQQRKTKSRKAGGFDFKALWQKFREKASFVSRRWSRIRSENRKHRFPESNRF